MPARRISAAVAAFGILAPAALAEWVPTNFGIGADAEVRESNPTQNRGNSTEIASRVKNEFISGDANDGSDRQSAIYTKFDLSGVVIPDSFHTAFRMSYRNNNLVEARIQDSITPNPAVRTGLAVFGVNNLDAGASWDESTITYLNAPGITFDGDVGTKDFNSDLTFLGTVLFPEIGTQNHLPIGGHLIFESANLDAFVADAVGQGVLQITLVSTVIHGGDSPFVNWLNFNYLFNPKEQTTLNTDNYDAGDGMGNVGNLFGTDNSTGEFSPSLLIESDRPVIPEPTTLALSLLAMAGIAASRRRGKRSGAA